MAVVIKRIIRGLRKNPAKPSYITLQAERGAGNDPFTSASKITIVLVKGGHTYTWTGFPAPTALYEEARVAFVVLSLTVVPPLPAPPAPAAAGANLVADEAAAKEAVTVTVTVDDLPANPLPVDEETYPD